MLDFHDDIHMVIPNVLNLKGYQSETLPKLVENDTV